VPTLPQVVDAFVGAVNRFDVGGITATFADDAIVNDHRVEFAGSAAIRDWAARELVADRVTLKVIRAESRGEGATVVAEVDGDFDKSGLPSPLVLSFYFSVSAGRVVQLVIVHCAPPTAAASPSTVTLAAKKTVVRRFFERFAAGDVPGTVALFKEDATYWFPTLRRALGIREFAAGLEWIQSRIDGHMQFELGPIVGEGNEVVVQLESFARTVDGKKFNNLYNIYFELDGDRISRAREYNDTAHVFATLRAGQKREEEWLRQ
jgi:ketosteroid isomerase-like protein